MTASIKILTTSTVDSSPSILLISPNGKRILVNCGEGCQRCFLESPTDKVRAVNQICVTAIGHATTGGLPGLILTSADVHANANAADALNKLKKKISSLSSSRQGGSDDDINNGDNDNNNNIIEPESKKSRHSIHSNNGDQNQNQNRNSTRSDDRVLSESVGGGGLQIIGPNGTQKFIHSLRHFMRRDNFHLSIHEGRFYSKAKAGDGVYNSSKRRKGKAGGAGRKGKRQQNHVQKQQQANDINEEQDKGIFGIESIPMKRKIKTLKSISTNDQQQIDQAGDDHVDVIEISSFIFTTSPIPGKFQVDKAKELRIPPGKMYAKLKSGESVTFRVGEEEEVTIEPSQVLEGGCDGVATAILYCPDEYVMDQLCSVPSHDDPDNPLNSLYKFSKISPSENNIGNLLGDKQQQANAKMEVMIHIIPKDLFESDKYQKFLLSFDHDIMHITIHPMGEHSFDGGNEDIDGSPFQSAILGAMTRSLIHDDIYMSPFPINDSDDTIDEKVSNIGNDLPKINNDQKSKMEQLNIVSGRAQMEYTMIPLSKRGLNLIHKNFDKNGVGKSERSEIHKMVTESGALEKAKDELESYGDCKLVDENCCQDCHIIFTGTGSAIPCKHRNVTGMYVEMKNGHGMLLDVGEGTIGQLIRCWKSKIPDDISTTKYIQSKLLNIKAVWISHPHADHHLGVIRFLSERNALLRNHCEQHLGRTVLIEDQKVVVMASTSLLNFLNEYSLIDPSISDGFIAIDCENTLLNRKHPMGKKLNENLGISECISVPVSHCRNSYALVVDCASFGRLVYSGDCRPSDRLVDIGSNADILIHEATFEDGMEEEAVLKRHSTVGEAISIGKKMKAKNVILTHFSQRYPRIPPLQKEGDSVDFPIAVAFDFMKVYPKSISIASKLTTSLRCLYPASDEAFSLEINPAQPSASETLSTPGAFALNASCL